MARAESAFLFDLDGTLVDSVYQHVLAWKEALDSEGIPLSVWRIHRKIGMSGGLFTHILLRETGIDITPERVDRLRRAHAAAYQGRAGSVRPLPGAVELLAWLTEQKIPWAIATSGRMETARHNLDALGVDPQRIPVVTRTRCATPSRTRTCSSPPPRVWASTSTTRWCSATASGTCSRRNARGRSASDCCPAATAKRNWPVRVRFASTKTRPTCCGTSTKSRHAADGKGRLRRPPDAATRARISA